MTNNWKLKASAMSNLFPRLTYMGQFLNGVGGAVTSVAPAVLSETWFPPTERNTATCVALLFASVGGGIAFVIGWYCILFMNYVKTLIGLKQGALTS